LEEGYTGIVSFKSYVLFKKMLDQVRGIAIPRDQGPGTILEVLFPQGVFRMPE
jgi:hypothetical protein